MQLGCTNELLIWLLRACFITIYLTAVWNILLLLITDILCLFKRFWPSSLFDESERIGKGSSLLQAYFSLHGLGKWKATSCTIWWTRFDIRLAGMHIIDEEMAGKYQQHERSLQRLSGSCSKDFERRQSISTSIIVRTFTSRWRWWLFTIILYCNYSYFSTMISIYKMFIKFFCIILCVKS